MSPLALRRRLGWPAIVIILLVAVAVLLFVFERRTTAQAADYRSARVGAVTRDGLIADQSARTAAQRAAVADTTTLLSYNAATLDRDFAKGKAVTTGQFAKDYAQQFTTFVKPTAAQYTVSVIANVVNSAVESNSPDTAVVLLFVDQTTKSIKLPAPRVDQNRVKLTMSRVHGTWLISSVAAL
jgi:Mce-associated membrane protein